MAGPWEKYKGPGVRMLGEPGPPKPPTGFAPVGSDAALQYQPGGPSDPAQIAAEAAARARVTAGIENASAKDLAQFRAGVETSTYGKTTGKNVDFDNTSKLRNELDTSPTAKAYKNAVTSYASAMQAADTGAGDLNIIYAYAKVLDPESVVREGEQAAVANLGGYGQRIFGEFRKQLDGQGRLPPDLRRNIMREMGTRVADYDKSYNFERARYRSLAERQGIDHRNVVGPHIGDAFAPIENQYWRGDPNKGSDAGRQDAQVAAEMGKFGIGGAPGAGAPPSGGVQPGGAPSSPPPAPPSPQDFERNLKQMLNDNRPADEILNYIKTSGSTLSPRDQDVMRQYGEVQAQGGAPNVGVRVQPSESTLGGIIEGAMKPLDRAAMSAEWLGNHLIPGLNSTSAKDAAAARPAALDATFGPRSEGGKTLGGLLGTLPLMALPGGAAFQGGVAGALLGDGHSLGGVAMDAGKGAIAGKAGDMAMKGIAGLLAPSLRPEVSNLAGEGVRPTVGQIYGGRVGRIENSLTSYPVVGGLVDDAQRASKMGYDNAGWNRPLKTIEEAPLPPETYGHDAAKYVKGRFGAGYEGALDGAGLVLDPAIAAALTKVKGGTRLPPNYADDLESIIQTEIGGPLTPGRGAMSGRDYKTMDSRLRSVATGLKGDAKDPYRQMMGRAVDEYRDVLRTGIGEQNPGLSERLDQLDAGYAQFARLRDAASRDVIEGLISPGNLRTAVRTGDRSVGKAATATGDAIMQDLARDGSKVFGKSFGNSGTSDRENVRNPVAWGLGALAAPLYRPGVQPAISSFLTAPRDPSAEIIAELLKSLPASTVTPALVSPGN